MRSSIKFVFGAIAACLMASATPVVAGEYIFSFEADAGLNATGTLTTENASNPQGGFLITNISGVYGGDEITQLLAVGAYAGNTNLLYADSDPLLDSGGFSFLAGGSERNIFHFFGDYVALGDGQGSFSLRPMNGAVPEPSTWMMFLVGFFAVGVAMRRKKLEQNVSVSYN